MPLVWLATPRLVGFEEAFAFIDRERLYGLGCGWVDIVLLASVMLTPGAYRKYSCHSPGLKGRAAVRQHEQFSQCDWRIPMPGLVSRRNG